jgi:hypothetical protein
VSRSPSSLFRKTLLTFTPLRPNIMLTAVGAPSARHYDRLSPPHGMDRTNKCQCLTLRKKVLFETKPFAVVATKYTHIMQTILASALRRLCRRRRANGWRCSSPYESANCVSDRFAAKSLRPCRMTARQGRSYTAAYVRVNRSDAHHGECHPNCGPLDPLFPSEYNRLLRRAGRSDVAASVGETGSGDGGGTCAPGGLRLFWPPRRRGRC